MCQIPPEGQQQVEYHRGSVLGSLLSIFPINDTEEATDQALIESADDTKLEGVRQICLRVKLLVRGTQTGQRNGQTQTVRYEKMTKAKSCSWERRTPGTIKGWRWSAWGAAFLGKTCLGKQQAEISQQCILAAKAGSTTLGHMEHSQQTRKTIITLQHFIPVLARWHPEQCILFCHLLHYKKAIDKLDYAQWRATKMVRDHSTYPVTHNEHLN